jgi:hypothetical protein
VATPGFLREAALSENAAGAPQNRDAPEHWFGHAASATPIAEKRIAARIV